MVFGWIILLLLCWTTERPRARQLRMDHTLPTLWRNLMNLKGVTVRFVNICPNNYQTLPNEDVTLALYPHLFAADSDRGLVRDGACTYPGEDIHAHHHRRPERQRGLDVVLDVGDAVHVGDGQVLREELADVLTGNAGRTAGSFARRSIG